MSQANFYCHLVAVAVAVAVATPNPNPAAFICHSEISQHIHRRPKTYRHWSHLTAQMLAVIAMPSFQWVRPSSCCRLPVRVLGVSLHCWPFSQLVGRPKGLKNSAHLPYAFSVLICSFTKLHISVTTGNVFLLKGLKSCKTCDRGAEMLIK